VADVGQVPRRGVAASVGNTYRLSTGATSYVFGLGDFVDRTIAMVGLVVLSPVLAVIAAPVRRRLGAPVLFRQLGLGLRGEPSEMGKFRAMLTDRRSGTDRHNHGRPDSSDRRRTHKTPADPRHTPLGRFLRPWHIDERPQLTHVGRGEMSLIGPCPELATLPTMLRNWGSFRRQTGGLCTQRAPRVVSPLSDRGVRTAGNGGAVTKRRSSQADDSERESEISRAVGRRLREVRRAKGLTLEQVAAASDHTIKMSTLGSYERGDRALTVARLCALAELYEVPAAELLPGPNVPTSASVIDLRDGTAESAASGESRALVSLESALVEKLVGEFARAVRVDRSPRSVASAMVRREDVDRISRLLGVERREVRRLLRNVELPMR